MSYGILVCNERDEIERLMTKLLDFIEEDDEIVVVADKDNVTDEVIEYINSLIADSKPIAIYYNPLNRDFAQQKNFMIDKCTGDYICNIDADEIPHDTFLLNIKELIRSNPTVEIFAIPRVNIVNGITEEYIAERGWSIGKLDSLVEEKILDDQSEEYMLLQQHNLIIEEETL